MMRKSLICSTRASFVLTCSSSDWISDTTSGARVMLADEDSRAGGSLLGAPATIDGKPWSQQPFAYQAKCLMWLREEYAALPASDRTAVDSALAGTGWAALFTT